MKRLNYSQNNLQDILNTISGHNKDLPPVEKWQPENCGHMDLVIRKDGSWWHEGREIKRKSLVKLFSRILRKDNDGKTYLVTPVEKIEITVECAHFLAVNMDVKQEDGVQYLFFTTNMGDVVCLDKQHKLTVITDEKTLEPTPLINVRGRLQALLSRSVFYELVELSESRETKNAQELGVMSAGLFFPIIPAGIMDNV